MASHVPIDALRDALRRGQYTATQHARQKKAARKVTWNELRDVVLAGDVIEERPDATPYPKALFMKEIRGDQPLYVSAAYDAAEDRTHIITVHWMDPTKWVDPWTRR